jgi:carbon monoxide dehydrogenase subunit G
MADHERTFLAMATADLAFEALSDPARLPAYVPVLRLDDSIAIEGEADAEATIAERDGASEAGFVADRKSGTITWARPERDYSGSITIAGRTSSTVDITLRLHTRDDTDAAVVSKAVDDAVANIRKLLTSLR